MLFMPSGLSVAIAMSALNRCAITFRSCWIITVMSTVLPAPLEPTMPSIGFLGSTKARDNGLEQNGQAVVGTRLVLFQVADGRVDEPSRAAHHEAAHPVGLLDGLGEFHP